MDILLPKMKSSSGFGSQENESWARTANWMFETGLIKKKPETKEMYIED